MIEIKQVKSYKQRLDFVSFPIKLYKDNKYFVPAIFMDELALFKSNCIHNKTCDQIFFLAYKDNKVVGRIQGIIQRQYNEIHDCKKARFSRFDSIDNQEVANALLKAVEDWAKEKSMQEIIGPMGYNDLEREGLLIEGFDYLSTYEEQYNYSYYQKLIENYNYQKDVDWVEYRIFPKFKNKELLEKMANRAKTRMNLHYGGENLNKNQYIKKYADGIFHCLDICYSSLYGTVPMTPEIKNNILSQFKLVLNTKYVVTVCNEKEEVVAFGIALPGFGKALQKSGGKLTIPTIIKLLKLVNKPDSLDFSLIGVLPQYQGTGINAYIMVKLFEILEDDNIKYLETNLNLETNINVQGQWKFFENIQHKRRRSFIKQI